MPLTIGGQSTMQIQYGFYAILRFPSAKASELAFCRRRIDFRMESRKDNTKKERGVEGDEKGIFMKPAMGLYITKSNGAEMRNVAAVVESNVSGEGTRKSGRKKKQ
ncbi:hypothetical protein KQX54_020999 [Cotesia glomerata]|uniref:Uncharacterized protein n=1 Tax=Cotesia glomerata TaxID=32391 RepID=A0AAV7HMH6_COTGL|nr:hypothetical protein KQX54_020999 [Cotesia glomerata]